MGGGLMAARLNCIAAQDFDFDGYEKEVICVDVPSANTGRGDGSLLVI